MPYGGSAQICPSALPASWWWWLTGEFTSHKYCLKYPRTRLDTERCLQIIVVMWLQNHLINLLKILCTQTFVCWLKIHSLPYFFSLFISRTMSFASTRPLRHCYCLLTPNTPLLAWKKCSATNKLTGVTVDVILFTSFYVCFKKNKNKTWMETKKL